MSSNAPCAVAEHLDVDFDFGGSARRSTTCKDIWRERERDIERAGGTERWRCTDVS